MSSLTSLKYYADSPNRRPLQILSDVLALVWIVLSIGAARNVYSGIQDVRPAVASLSSAGDSIATNLAGATKTVALVPIIIIAGPWALLRYRFIRRATNAQHWLTRPGTLELFALRALVAQPLDRLEPLGDDAVGGFLRKDQATLRAFAALELEAYGVTPRETDGEPAVSA
jgi:hypothetical protein